MSNPCVDIIMATRPPDKYKRNSQQSIRDHEKIVRRMKSVGVLPDFILAYLEKTYNKHLTTASLLMLANTAVYSLNLPIDRLAKRNRQALLCWFAEHWNVIYPLLGNLLAYDMYCSDLEENLINEKQCYLGDRSLNPLDIKQLLNNH